MQISLFCDYRGNLNSKYETLFLALEQVYDASPKKRSAGRIGYGQLAFIKALVYKHAEEIPSIPELLRNLRRNPAIAEMIGFYWNSLPNASRFYTFLSKTKSSQLKNLYQQAVKLLLEEKVVSLNLLIADSKPVKAYTKHNNPKNPSRSMNKKDKIPRNPQATFGYYSYSKQPHGKTKQFTFFWGFRTHVLVSQEGIPLVEITKPNNISDDKIASMLLKKLLKVYGQQKNRIFIADAAYDKRYLYTFVKEQIKGEALIPINKRNEQPKKLLGANGCPICQANLEMKYHGLCKEPHRTRKAFRCPITAGSRKEKAKLPTECPCMHEKFLTGKCYGCAACIDVTDDARSQVPRQSKHYEENYAKRTEVERYFSRLGRREIEQTTHFTYRSIRNQITIAHFSLVLTAIASALILSRPDKICCYRSFADVG